MQILNFEIPGAEAWEYTVKAKLVEAKRDFMRSIALILFSLIFFAWSAHVLRRPIPHDYGEPTEWCSLTTGGAVAVGASQREDKGISKTGWLLIISAVTTTGIGLLLLWNGIENGILDLASLHTVEYDAYRELLGNYILNSREPR